jgi:hypothetical protein
MQPSQSSSQSIRYNIISEKQHFSHLQSPHVIAGLGSDIEETLMLLAEGACLPLPIYGYVIH